jgi:hypothetical protein
MDEIWERHILKRTSTLMTPDAFHRLFWILTNGWRKYYRPGDDFYGTADYFYTKKSADG